MQMFGEAAILRGLGANQDPNGISSVFDYVAKTWSVDMIVQKVSL